MAPYLGADSSALPTGGPTSGVREDFDDLFDYEVAGADDPFADLDKVKSAKPIQNATKKSSAATGLGIDKEVEVVKKVRAPTVKLDEQRLLSQAGIPKLRRKAKDLKFKGKGHEYSDAARLLSFYQLWLDDLFPKAKFLDAAAMVEKLGHKRRMQMMRMEWINESKPRPVLEDSIFNEPTLPASEKISGPPNESRIAPIFETSAKQERPQTPAVPDDDEDIYGATPLAQRKKSVESHKSIFGGGHRKSKSPEPVEVSDDEFDFDAMLAEHEMSLDIEAAHMPPKPAAKDSKPEASNFDDEMEAMDAMGNMDELW